MEGEAIKESVVHGESNESMEARSWRAHQEWPRWM